MAIRVFRTRRARVAIGAAVAAMAIAAPSAAAAADTTAPSAPTEAGTYFDFRCTERQFVHWLPSTDNVDSLTDLRYRFYDAAGQVISRAATTDFQSDPYGGISYIDLPRVPVTVRAVDRAGNLSAPAPVVNEGRQ
jgi:hypothetical protein